MRAESEIQGRILKCLAAFLAQERTRSNRTHTALGCVSMRTSGHACRSAINARSFRGRSGNDYRDGATSRAEQDDVPIAITAIGEAEIEGSTAGYMTDVEVRSA